MTESKQDFSEQKKDSNIKIKIKEDDLRGVYSNLMQISHTKEEFVLDFFFLGHMIGHPEHPTVGEAGDYVGQGIAVFLGGVSFFYTVGLIPLIIGFIWEVVAPLVVCNP